MKKKINVLYIILIIILCFTVNPNKLLAGEVMKCYYHNTVENNSGSQYSFSTSTYDFLLVIKDGKVFDAKYFSTGAFGIENAVNNQGGTTVTSNVRISKNNKIENPTDFTINNWVEAGWQKKLERKCVRYRRRYNDFTSDGKLKSCPQLADYEAFKNDNKKGEIVFYNVQFAIGNCKNETNNKNDDKVGYNQYIDYYKGENKFSFFQEQSEDNDDNDTTIEKYRSTETITEEEYQKQTEEILAESNNNKKCAYHKDGEKSSSVIVTIDRNGYVTILEGMNTTDNSDDGNYTIAEDLNEILSAGTCIDEFYFNENTYSTEKCDTNKNKCHKYTNDKNETVEIDDSKYKYKEFKIKTKNIDNCKDLIGDDGIELIDEIMNVIKIVVPILLLVFGIIDFLKATFAGSEDDMSKAKKNFMKRLIAAVVVFLTPILINFLLGVANNVWSNIHAADCIK